MQRAIDPGGPTMSQQITIVGGGLAGLTAAIACAEGGAKVRLLEAHETLGGRARSNDGPVQSEPRPARPLSGRAPVAVACRAQPAPAHVSPALAGAAACGFAGRARCGARRRWARFPRCCACAAVRRPVELDFRSWAASHTDERTARAAVCGGRRLHLPSRSRRAVGGVRLAADGPPVSRAPPDAARYASGGWSDRWSHARAPRARARRERADRPARGGAARAGR